LLVSAWPEPLSAIPADSTAEPTAGAIESSRTVQSRLHRLHCATDCAIQWVGLLSVASGKPTSVRNTLAPLRRGFFVSAIRHRNQRLGSAFRQWLAADARAPSLSIPLVLGSARRQLVGTWELVSTSGETADGKRMEAPFGQKPLGYLMFSPSGHFSYNWVHPDRPKFASQSPGGLTRGEPGRRARKP
jgi:hypothetical protein